VQTTGENQVNKVRMVRLVIVFLQNILKQKVISFEDISEDIRNFCLEHIAIKESNEMLKKVIAE
jgi:hypothetical protein